MDLAVYDRRARRVRIGLALCLIVSLGIWYVADFHPELLNSEGKRWLPYALMLVFMAALGAYANGLIAELRHHAIETHQRGEEARVLARRDQLTGTLNRATFLEDLARNVRAAKAGAPVALFLLDLDRFKSMNDIFGHAFGDAVLKRVGHVLAREIGAERIGRLGGDEFAFMLTGPVSKTTCEAVGERILKALAEPAVLLGRTANIEGSIGVAWSPEHDLDQLDLMACADLALYLAKQAGRRRVACFDRDLMKEERYRRSIERELRGAILTNELDVHYQPIVDAVDTRVHALEALVRWRHPVRGMMSPAEFVPVAEQSTLIEQLGRWVLARVCADAARWPGLQIGINVSPAQLKRREFVDTVREVLAETGCDPKAIAIEITEGLLMDGSAGQVAHLNELRSLGIGIWLDDFGAGFSGLSYLRDFPIDVIKIDKSFVHDMRTAHANRVFVSTIAQMGRGLDKLVIAEGIETADDLALVRAAGCSHGQGFHFARPMAADDVGRFLERHLSGRAA